MKACGLLICRLRMVKIITAISNLFLLRVNKQSFMQNAVMQPSDDTSSCFHCGLPVISGTHFSAKVFGQPQAMCCLGCQSVAESIVE
ncbi:MAG: hypothetical protein EBV25_05605, partial [Methylophilaceae bacterium]|nr:hypothetical protein [Methylophilaceae bacterium]